MDSSTSRELDHEKARDRHKHHSKPETVPGKNGDHQMGDTQSIHARSEEPSLLRKTTGQAMHQLSNLVNENIVVARYGTMATVSLLVAYGFYRTPLFFRYKTVAEIPAELFTNRRTLHGRIVHINTTGMTGVKVSPHYRNSLESEWIWLRGLAADRAPVAFQLLARKVVKPLENLNDTRKDSPSQMTSQNCHSSLDPETKNIAICHLRYRPPKSILRQDLGLSLIRRGRANVASGIHVEDRTRTTVDGSTKIGDIRKDITYLEKLEMAEFDAVKERLGMWNDEHVRKQRPDLVNEANFEMTAGMGKKLWRWASEKAWF